MTASYYDRRIEESVEVDLTPMLDVVFIMLIFFIVTASFIREDVIEVDRPSHSDSLQHTENKNIVVTLSADNQINIFGRRVDHRALRAYFERHLAQNPDAALIISADNASKTYTVSRVADAARRAGLFNILLANNP